MEIAAIGNPDFVVGFRLVGVKKIFETTPDTFEKTVQEALDNKDVGIVVVDMKDVDRLPATLKKRLIDSTTPVVIPIGKDEGDLRDKVRRAIGVDLYKGE
jgi:V/A-type H+/Na+-transporting ATPase subunit F